MNNQDKVKKIHDAILLLFTNQEQDQKEVRRLFDGAWAANLLPQVKSIKERSFETILVNLGWIN